MHKNESILTKLIYKKKCCIFAQIVLTLNVLDGCVQFRLSRFRRCFTGSFGIVYNIASSILDCFLFILIHYFYILYIFTYIYIFKLCVTVELV